MRYGMSAIFLSLVLVPWCASASADSSYAGQEQRPIKSLSEQETESLRRGDGMGLARLAELNHFPGPRHVLDLSRELDLSSQQLADTRALYDEMNKSAVSLGMDIIEAEAELDKEFQQGSITPDYLDRALQEIGRLRSELRYVHLRAHLSQKQLLSAEQVRTYDALRGYDQSHHDHTDHQRLHPASSSH